MIFQLLVGHALADFSLQTEWMSKNKNRNRKPDYIPEGQKYTPTWFYVLSAHALVHGGMVFLITGRVYLGILETILHWIADFAKCENWTNPHTDQLIHICSKLLWYTIIQSIP